MQSFCVQSKLPFSTSVLDTAIPLEESEKKRKKKNFETKAIEKVMVIAIFYEFHRSFFMSEQKNLMAAVGNVQKKHEKTVLIARL